VTRRWHCPARFVDSTARAAQLGDRAWHDVLDDHDRRVRAAVEGAGGRVVKTTGDDLHR
jgi:class 3 adenylate cyclase